jgi:hypothetical protein
LNPTESENPLSAGMVWASRVTSLGLEFALPAWAGFWIDGKYGTRPWCAIAGSLLGFATGMVHLLRIARQGTRGSASRS